ncbi:helicase-related protein [Hymenobacter lapidiphilus]|uniref:NgoFVII family restriction endonuclease n=1 Tax=Hymenobacter lapidiphilus TaxID=2608003 RepID=A0A7Y7U5P2_9BACT|nr:helicase-related protein [Hymenobacter lapidiphilus]NVO31663.1 NgoFVII family restriction endonuclease [Hymenobacter lapidiphilus]
MSLSDHSLIRDNAERGAVADFLTAHLAEPGAECAFVSAYFTINAYHHSKLKGQFDGIKKLRFLFGEPNFLNLDPEKTSVKEFRLAGDQLSLYNALKQREAARDCAQWISDKVEIRSMVKPNFLHGKLYHISQHGGKIQEAIMGSSNFTVAGLGLTKRANRELNMVVDSKATVQDLKQWFEELWTDPTLVRDVREEVLKYLRQLYVDTPPELVYYKTLYHLFGRFLEEQVKGGLLTEKTGFYESEVWNQLYSFQKDGVRGAINKLLRHGGCIIADSVGLGKTFEALAVIRYFELLNGRVLVICPKKLSENWTIYQAHKGDSLNPFKKDRFSYTVLYHTDLNRPAGAVAAADGINLDNFTWGAYDLVVIDESHNFRNSSTAKDGRGPTRYQRVLNDVIASGVKTKVLLLSATPVNNTLRDLRNQLYLITEGKDDALAATTGVANLGQTLKLAQSQFTQWAEGKPGHERNAQELFEKLDSGFFKLLDEMTIARSRNQIKRNYDSKEMGEFPKRLKPLAVFPDIDLKGKFPSYDAVNKLIEGYQLSLYNPSRYVREEYKAYYEDVARQQMQLRIATFTQAKREMTLINMMKIGFLKRLESSVKSFQISMGRTLEKMQALQKRIHAFQTHQAANPDIDFADIQPEADPEGDDDLAAVLENFVGKNLKFNLAHLRLDDWLTDLRDDFDRLSTLESIAAVIDGTRDAKLADLRQLITDKLAAPLNGQNKKIIVFTAFADTASYLYQQLHGWLRDTHNVHTALVSGGAGTNQTTFTPAGFARQTDFNAILTNFSPVSKKRHLQAKMPQQGEISVLIATDCISEGQNLQDGDYLVNYDIHWNPVRIIQRFGRIDRLGSINTRIQLVNFWPTPHLDKYINLKSRVEARMALADISAAGDDNLLGNDRQLEELIAEDELKFRDRQLLRLKDEVLDLEDLQDSVSLSDFTLDDFRAELLRYLDAHRQELENAPPGLYAVVPAPGGDYAHLGGPDYDKLSDAQRQVLRPGTVFCLRQLPAPNTGLDGTTGSAATNRDEELDKVNPLQPHFLVYVRQDGTVRYNYVNAKQTLEMLRLLCVGQTEPIEQLCDLFSTETGDGHDMSVTNELLNKALAAIKATFRKRANLHLKADRAATLMAAPETEGFELVTWVVLR